MGNIDVKINGFRPEVQEEMLFNGISYLELWQPFFFSQLKPSVQ